LPADTLLISEGGSGSDGTVSAGKIGSSGVSKSSSTSDAAAVKVDVNYARLTMGDTETHAANMIMNVEDETVSVSVNVIDGEDKEEIRLDMGDGVNQIGLYVTHSENEEGDAETAATDVNFVLADPDMSMNLTLKLNEKVQEKGENANAWYDVALLLDETELFGLTVEVSAAEAEASIVTDDAIRLATISDEDFQAWFVNVVNGLQSWLMTAAEALPASVLMLLMGM